MSQLDQIQITYTAAEDRLLLRLSTQTSEEFRFWLTRRFVKALRPHLQRTLSSQPRIQVQPDPAAKQELLKFERELAVQASDFETPYRAQEKSLPLGVEPVVLTRFQVRPRDDGSIVLAVAPEQGKGIDLALNPHLVHSFIALLDNALKSADWNLDERVDPGTRSDASAGSATIN
jgi:hypothetical protein